MKYFSYAFLIVTSNAFLSFSQPNKFIGEKNGKYGILDGREEFFEVKPMFGGAHANTWLFANWLCMQKR